MIHLSFFSGALGLDLGLERSGFETLLASEIDPSARETISINRPNVKLIGNLLEYTGDDILRIAGLARGQEIDLISGGPPCQAFSTAGKRHGLNDDRGNVFLKFISIIDELKPRYAVIENVRGLLSAPLEHRPHRYRGEEYMPLDSKEQRGGVLALILNLLRKAGYTVSFNLYNSANFGVPQIRERVVLLCYRGDKLLDFLEPTASEDGSFNLPKWMTFREAVTGLNATEMEYIKFPEKRLAYYRLLKPGQNWRDLPSHLQAEALGGSYHAGGGKTGFFRRLDWDKPSPTLVTNPSMPATDLCHPECDRPLSVQEYMRLQQFPDDWRVAGKILDKYRQLGNAVPVGLGEAIGTAIMNHTVGLPTNKFSNFKYSRYKCTSHLDWQTTMTQLQHKLPVT